jgi:hypothetical protein
VRLSAIPLALLAVSLLGCGGSDRAERACDLLGEQDVVAALRGAGVEQIVLRRTSTESLDQSICAYRGQGTSVRLNVDSAPEVRRRYFNRVTEALHLSSNDPANRPQPVQGLGDQDALGPAGAYWIDDFRQLFVLRGERQFIYQVSARGLAAQRARDAAVRLARATLPGNARRAEAPATGADGPLELEVLAPEDGERVRSDRVAVRGAVSGREAAVTVNGRAARVEEGIFARSVALRRGRNRIRISAVAGGPPLSRTVVVYRGRSARAVGAAFARRHPGVVPDVLAEPLGDAQEILDGAGLEHRVVKLVEGSLRAGAWSVCRTRPFPGARLRARRVVLFADREDLLRTSGTACAQE